MHRLSWAMGLAVAAMGCKRPTPPAAPAVASYVEVISPARRGGPLADYDPVLGVAIHHEVQDMVPELRPALGRWLGGRLMVADHSAADASAEPEDPSGDDLTLLWMRDYQPIHLRDAEGRLSLVHYLAENPNRSVFRPAAEGPARNGRTWMPTPSGGRWLPSRLLPLVHENGNLLVAGRRVIVSDKLIEDNAEVREEPHLLAHGYRPRGRDEVLRLLARALDRSVSEIVVLPQMPYEATGHVDVFVLPLDDRTVMVPKLEDRALADISGRAHAVGRVVQVFLDEQALHLESLGFAVPRWPMIPPALALPQGDEEQDDGSLEALAAGFGEAEAGTDDLPGPDDPVAFELLVFTPANTLLLDLSPGRSNEPARKLAFLPGFVKTFSDPVMASLAASYTRRWQKALRDRGFIPEVVDASELVGYLGLLRCVSAPIFR